jgi:hypothetical protein
MTKKTLAELEAEAYAKHGSRAGALLSLVGDGKATKANWQKVIDAPVDERDRPALAGAVHTIFGIRQ